MAGSIERDRDFIRPLRYTPVAATFERCAAIRATCNTNPVCSK